MKHSAYKALPPLALIFAIGLIVTGCALFKNDQIKPRAFDVAITLDKALAGMSLQVELIGANKTSDLPKWESLSITEYWQPGNSLRRDANKISFEFAREKPSTVTVSKDDPHWKQWFQSGAIYLVVIADLPGITTDQSGNADSRRLILPLDRRLWKKNQKLELLIQESGIRLLSKQKNEK